ncbi:hypothetical protein OAJ57_02285 [Alphaproteobacteria bacterium]|nr:hypothetical protein [Alphaproteobacteria bacterium]
MRPIFYPSVLMMTDTPLRAAPTLPATSWTSIPSTRVALPVSALPARTALWQRFYSGGALHNLQSGFFCT